jgi:hypothetical protein
MSLVLSLPFNEGGGTVAYDNSGNGDNFTLTSGVVWTDGRNGKALSFNGASGCYLYDGGIHGLISNAMTLSVWVNPTSGYVDYIGIICNVNGGGNNNRLLIGVASRKLLSQFTIGGSSANYFSSGSITNDVWTHVAYVCDGSNQKYYINGVLDGATLPCSGNISYGSGTITIVGKGQGNLYNFQGVIDDIRIYNYGLSQAQIYELVNGGICWGVV